MIELVLLLAATCVAEIDLQDDAEECVVMWSINARTAARRHVSLLTQTLNYNAYWDPRRDQAQKVWIGELLPGDHKPPHWPERRSWDAEKSNWFRYVAAAERFVAAGGPRNSCRADHYGGTPGDGKHADDKAPCPQARRVRCLRNELQAYWDAGPCRRARRRGMIPADAAARPGQ